jgi:hypothetical protein
MKSPEAIEIAALDAVEIAVEPWIWPFAQARRADIDRYSARLRHEWDGLVDSINRPGGNVTGATFFAATLTAKKFDLLPEIVPQATDIGLLVNPTGALAKMEIKEMSEATQRLGQHLHIANVSNEDEINTAMAGDAHRCLSQCWITRRRCGPN